MQRAAGPPQAWHCADLGSCPQAPLPAGLQGAPSRLPSARTPPLKHASVMCSCHQRLVTAIDQTLSPGANTSSLCWPSAANRQARRARACCGAAPPCHHINRAGQKGAVTFRWEPGMGHSWRLLRASCEDPPWPGGLAHQLRSCTRAHAHWKSASAGNALTKLAADQPHVAPRHMALRAQRRSARSGLVKRTCVLQPLRCMQYACTTRTPCLCMIDDCWWSRSCPSGTGHRCLL